MADVALLAGGVQEAPLDYVIPGAQVIAPKSASATFDGSGAGGAFVPCLQIIAPNGAVLASCPTSDSVAAGASADVSWFPRGTVSKGGAAGATGTESFNDGFFGEDIIVGGQVDLQWLNPAGDALLDLTNPRAPTIVADGIYAVTTDVLVDRLTTATPGMPLYAQLYFASFVALLGQTALVPWPAGTATPFNIPLSGTVAALAGGLLKITVANYNSATMRFNHVTTVQRIA